MQGSPGPRLANSPRRSRVSSGVPVLDASPTTGKQRHAAWTHTSREKEVSS